MARLNLSYEIYILSITVFISQFIFFYEIIEDTADGMWLTNGPMTLSNIEQLRTQKSHCGGRGSDGNNRF